MQYGSLWSHFLLEASGGSGENLYIVELGYRYINTRMCRERGVGRSYDGNELDSIPTEERPLEEAKCTSATKDYLLHLSPASYS